MALTPEEKNKIYEEEKTRLEAQMRLKDEKKSAERQLSAQINMVIWAIIGSVIVFSFVIHKMDSKKTQQLYDAHKKYKREMDKLMKEGAKNYEEYMDRGSYLMGEHPIDAISDFTAAIKLKPKNGEAYSYRAATYFYGLMDSASALKDVIKAESLGWPVHEDFKSNLNTFISQPRMRKPPSEVAIIPIGSCTVKRLNNITKLLKQTPIQLITISLEAVRMFSKIRLKSLFLTLPRLSSWTPTMQVRIIVGHFYILGR